MSVVFLAVGSMIFRWELVMEGPIESHRDRLQGSEQQTRGKGDTTTESRGKGYFLLLLYSTLTS